jgi:hypothetical protein
MPTRCVDVFLACATAVREGTLIHRVSKHDKEFHFQNWFAGRLDEVRAPYDPPSRNTYPDFRLVELPEGYEVKGLQFPGREANYDSNSQVPTGHHNGREIYYFFGRYPKDPEEDDYPVIDLVACHGDFLNADHEYRHRNKSFKGFGTYGDIMVRDRKMYVAPTPFALTDGTTARITLLLPREMQGDSRLEAVGELVRVECERLVVGYKFDLRANELTPEYVENPGAGTPHHFVAYRVRGSTGPGVSMKAHPVLPSGE